MATDDNDNESSDVEAERDGAGLDEEIREPESATGEPAAENAHAPSQLGVVRYVHASFIGAGLILAYICGKVAAALWSYGVEWPWLVHAIPKLQSFSESERDTIGMVVGLVIGAGATLWAYRYPRIRGFADEVASELSKVTWPNKEAVTNGTIVVVVASAVAAVYIALLDRLWTFVTALIYDV